MQDYARYNIKDFLADEAFCSWVLHPKPADNAFWDNWLRSNPDRADIVAQAKRLIYELHEAQDYLSEEELQYELERISSARTLATEEIALEKKPRRSFVPLAIATGLSAFLILLAYIDTNPFKKSSDQQISQNLPEEQQNEEWIEVINNQSDSKRINLPDGSTAKLSARSKLRYPAAFVQNEREVLLNGEAFFEVIKNPESPFKVYTSDLVTTVLGTSFTVKAFDQDKDVRVVVKTGKVTVSANAAKDKTPEPEKNELVLLPNQQVVYHRDEQKMKRSLIENPSQVGPPEVISRNLVFEDAPVAKVFESLQRRYEVQIIYDADLLAGCQLTAELGQEPLFEKLAMICKAIQARYELIDGQIVIHGSSCR